MSATVADAGIKSSIHGIGGDELFGGYPSFRDVPRALQLCMIPTPLRKLMGRMISGDRLRRSKIGELLQCDCSVLETFLIRRRIFSFQQRRELLGQNPPPGRSGLPEEWFSWMNMSSEPIPDMFAAISRLELIHYAGNKLLIDGDVMSMANSMEVRFPLLDVDLVRAVLKTSSNEKKYDRKGFRKPALVNTIPGFPGDLMSPRKRGFTLPVGQWMKNELNAGCKQFLLEGGLSDFLTPSGTAKAWGRFVNSPDTNEWIRVWALYVLGCWKNVRVGV